MITKEHIEAIITEQLRGTSTVVVDILVKPGNTIVVYIDDVKGVTFDHCIILSRAIEENLNRDIEDFSLEVSSAGIGSPFKVRQQYQKAIGKTIDIVLKDGRKITGLLCSVADNGIIVTKKVSKSRKKSQETDVEDINEYILWENIKKASEVINFK